MASRRVKASVIQACTVQYDLDATLAKLDQLVGVAKERDGAQLAVFPEAFIGGYPRNRTFGCVVGTRDPAGRDEYLAYYNSAITVPGPAVTALEQIAARHGVFLVGGVIEKQGGTLYCTVVWIDPQEGLLDKRRKLMPTAAEKLIWRQGSAADVKVVPTVLSPKITVQTSAAICWENYMPLHRYALYRLGTELYCAPTVDGRESWATTMKHIALEGRCFVLSANQFSRQKDHPDDVDFTAKDKAADPDAPVILGGSLIVDPHGNVLAGPLRGEEGVLSAELDLDEVIRGKLDLDVSGHYSRSDIFDLRIRGEQR